MINLGTDYICMVYRLWPRLNPWSILFEIWLKEGIISIIKLRAEVLLRLYICDQSVSEMQKPGVNITNLLIEKSEDSFDLEFDLGKLADRALPRELSTFVRDLSCVFSISFFSERVTVNDFKSFVFNFKNTWKLCNFSCYYQFYSWSFYRTFILGILIWHIIFKNKNLKSYSSGTSLLPLSLQKQAHKVEIELPHTNHVMNTPQSSIFICNWYLYMGN